MIYSSKEAFECYLTYLAIKRHFTSSYDYFKYNGKIKANQSSFESRRDKFFFFKLSKENNFKDIILANLLDDPKKWIGEIAGDDKIYPEWKKRTGSLSRTTSSELSRYDDWKEAFRPVNGNHPKIFTDYIAGRVSPETLCCVHSITGVFDLWDREISDTIIYPEEAKKLCKYLPFLEINEEKVRKTLTNII